MRHADSAVRAIDNLLALCYDDTGLVDKLQDLRSLVLLKLQYVDMLYQEVQLWTAKVREYEQAAEDASRGDHASRDREEPEPDRGDVDAVLERREDPAPPEFRAKALVQHALQPRAKRFPRRARGKRRPVGPRRR